MKNIEINNIKYELEKDYKDSFDLSLVKELCIDVEYFGEFDYLFGDYSYGKLRIKGFNDKSNSKYTEVNSIDKLDEYISKYCAYNCGYFLLKKVK
ncbi:MAG: DUF1027 domain-containing protein [Bacilli bacterium]|nr:DUF1027 domain-containing protein [Bacilli bacterium]